MINKMLGALAGKSSQGLGWAKNAQKRPGAMTDGALGMLGRRAEGMGQGSMMSKLKGAAGAVKQQGMGRGQGMSAWRPQGTALHGGMKQPVGNFRDRLSSMNKPEVTADMGMKNRSLGQQGIDTGSLARKMPTPQPGVKLPTMQTPGAGGAYFNQLGSLFGKK
jgi:hypothetical protein